MMKKVLSWIMVAAIAVGMFANYVIKETDKAEEEAWRAEVEAEVANYHVPTIEEYGFKPGIYYKKYVNTTYFIELESDGTVHFNVPSGPLLSDYYSSTELFAIQFNMGSYEDDPTSGYLYVNEWELSGLPAIEDGFGMWIGTSYDANHITFDVSHNVGYALDQQLYDMCIKYGVDFGSLVAGFGYSAWRSPSLEDMIAEKGQWTRLSE